MSSIPDLAQLPAPNVVEALDYETILGAHRADLLARYPAAAEVIALESEPLAKLLQAHAYRELLYRQRVNDAARAYLLAYATGADLDHKGAFYGLPRLPGEADERYRVRIQLRIRALAGNGTRWLYVRVVFNFEDADGETIRELGITFGAAPVAGLPAGQRYFTPAQIAEPGRLYTLERVPAFTRNGAVRQTFEYVLPF